MKTKKQNPIVNALVGMVIIAAVVVLFWNREEPVKQTHTKRIEAQFSPLNGEHVNLTNYIKESIANPGSYKTVNTVYFDKDTVLIVNQQFTAANELGETVPGFIRASFDTNGRLIEVLEAR